MHRTNQTRRITTTAPRDALGLAPAPSDRPAIEVMAGFSADFRTVSVYPSTVRTQIVPRLRAPWHWVWPLESPWDINCRPGQFSRWFAHFTGLLEKRAVWAGLIEYDPAGIGGYFFVGVKRDTNPKRLFAELLFCWSQVGSFRRPLVYQVKKGPAYYLKDVRYPCSPLHCWPADKPSRAPGARSRPIAARGGGHA